MGHLLGGLATLAPRMGARARRSVTQPAWAPAERLSRAERLAAIARRSRRQSHSGWTSSHYAALACPDFPTCQGQWWPPADFREAFIPWRAQVADFTGGTLEHPARVAIHLTHRMGALLTTIVLGATCIAVIIRARQPTVRRAAIAVALVLVAQVTVGITMVERGLPLGTAVAHNAVAALLLLSVVNMNHLLWRTR